MHEPKFVIAIGSCALSGGVFQGCYNVLGGIEKVIPVDAYVPGCPPRPEAIIDGVVKLLSSLKAPKGGDGTEAQASEIVEKLAVEHEHR
jgi:ech hydrogenase subunit C